MNSWHRLVVNALTHYATLCDNIGKEIHLILLFDPINSTSQHGGVQYYCKNIDQIYFHYKNVVCVICETYHDCDMNDSWPHEARWSDQAVKIGGHGQTPHLNFFFWVRINNLNEIVKTQEVMCTWSRYGVKWNTLRYCICTSFFTHYLKGHCHD